MTASSAVSRDGWRRSPSISQGSSLEAGCSTSERSPGTPPRDDYWSSFTLGVGPAGAYCRSLGEAPRASVRDECRRRRLGDPPGPFTLAARAWAVRGRADTG
jgi:hypothetical protein